MAAGTSLDGARRTRGRSRRALRSLGAALAIAALLACASEPRRERSVLVAGGDQVYLILPLNLSSVMPKELEPFGPIVWSEIENVLRAHEKQLKTVARPVARKLWLESIGQARLGEKGARAGFDDAARMLALELRKHAEFDAMIAPSLFVRKALIENRVARWDGVERTVELAASGLAAHSLADTPLEGIAPAASLHVAVFDAKGEKLHEGVGGLELLTRARFTGLDDAGEPVFAFEPRRDLFAEHGPLRDGIGTAFLPFLPPLSD